jgi:phage FluMu protein Com
MDDTTKPIYVEPVSEIAKEHLQVRGGGMIHAIQMTTITAQVEQVFQQMKMQCHSCHKTLFYFDADGFHLKCTYCKQITTITWTEIQATYHETHPEQKEEGA